RHLEVSRSGYYAWRHRPVSAHARRDAELGERVVTMFEELRGTAGAPTIVQELNKQGERTSKRRVARLMQEASLSAKSKQKWVVTTDSNHELPVAENLLNRDFEASQPNRAWV